VNRRTKFIFNPYADRGRAWRIGSTLQSAAETHGGASWSATEHPDHATELAEQAAREGYDVVASVGGDGTIHEIVNGLMRLPAQQRPLLGSVPIGSGNDFSANNGVVLDPEEAVHRVFTGTPKPVDVGQLTDGSGRTEYWDNTLGIGFGAFVTLYSYEMTRLQGFIMYLWAVILTIIRNHDAPRMVLTTDTEKIEKEIQYLVLCNGPREGGGFYVAPDAKPDDGIFHYALIERVSRLMMFRLVPEVMKGTHGRFKPVKLGSFHEMKLTSERPISIHTDGEIFAGFTSDVTELEVKIHPQALQLIT
jgi:diacylglycerol kinase (ATP)